MEPAPWYHSFATHQNLTLRQNQLPVYPVYSSSKFLPFSESNAAPRFYTTSIL